MAKKQYVGVRFQRPKGTSKTYYYSTSDKNINVGDKVKIKTYRSGTPDVKIVSKSDKKGNTGKASGVKPLKVIK